jgi:hypothetical protein
MLPVKRESLYDLWRGVRSRKCWKGGHYREGTIRIKDK